MRYQLLGHSGLRMSELALGTMTFGEDWGGASKEDSPKIFERFAEVGGNHRKNLIRSLEGSLRRLGTDRVDLFWLHMWDGMTPVEEVLRTMDDMVRALRHGVGDARRWHPHREVPGGRPGRNQVRGSLREGAGGGRRRGEAGSERWTSSTMRSGASSSSSPRTRWLGWTRWHPSTSGSPTRSWPPTTSGD